MHALSTDHSPVLVTDGAAELGLERDEMLREAEAIRRRIAENESFLRSGPPVPAADETPNPPLREAAIASEAGVACYLYGVVKETETGGLRLTSAGVGDGAPVELVVSDGLAAVVSEVSLEDFGEEEIEANLKDTDWATAKGRAHHEVLTELLSLGLNPVPMRFCTIFQGQDRVVDTLRENRESFLSSLDRMAKRTEWGVKVYCDQAVARQWVEDKASGVDALKKKTENAQAGMAYFLRKKMENLLDAEVERAADEAAQARHDALAAISVDAVVLALQEREVTGRAEAMLLNGAYLVDDGSTAEFEAAVQSLTREYQALGCSFELTGPWPGYNFATVDTDEAVDE